MNLIKAHSNDAERIKAFYKYAIDNTENMDIYGHWIYGLHPTDGMIDTYIRDGYIIEESARKSMKAVRMDALCCNAPAHRLYESLGFQKCGVQNWYAENTGYIDFYLYEYRLSD